MDYKELATKIKAKYPQYADMDDRELAQKIVDKYPDDYSDVTFGSDLAQPEPAQPEPAEPKRGAMDIAMSGAADRIEDRARRIQAPTSIGGALQSATGTTGTLGSFVEGFGGAPERIARTVIGAGATLGEFAGVPVEAAARGVNTMTGGGLKRGAIELITPPQKSAEYKPLRGPLGFVERGLNETLDYVGKTAISTAVGAASKFAEWWASRSEAEKANLATVPDAIEAFTELTGLKVAGDVAEKVVKGAVREGTEKVIPKLAGAADDLGTLRAPTKKALKQAEIDAANAAAGRAGIPLSVAQEAAKIGEKKPTGFLAGVEQFASTNFGGQGQMRNFRQSQLDAAKTRLQSLGAPIEQTTAAEGLFSGLGKNVSGVRGKQSDLVGKIAANAPDDVSENADLFVESVRKGIKGAADKQNQVYSEVVKAGKTARLDGKEAAVQAKKQLFDAGYGIFEETDELAKAVRSYADIPVENRRNALIKALKGELKSEIDPGEQWDLITGKRTVSKSGRPIEMTQDTKTKLQKVADYYNSEEGHWFLTQNEIDLGATVDSPDAIATLLSNVEKGSKAADVGDDVIVKTGRKIWQPVMDADVGLPPEVAKDLRGFIDRLEKIGDVATESNFTNLRSLRQEVGDQIGRYESKGLSGATMANSKKAIENLYGSLAAVEREHIRMVGGDELLKSLDDVNEFFSSTHDIVDYSKKMIGYGKAPDEYGFKTPTKAIDDILRPERYEQLKMLLGQGDEGTIQSVKRGIAGKIMDGVTNDKGSIDFNRLTKNVEAFNGKDPNYLGKVMGAQFVEDVTAAVKAGDLSPVQQSIAKLVDDGNSIKALDKLLQPKEFEKTAEIIKMLDDDSKRYLRDGLLFRIVSESSTGEGPQAVLSQAKLVNKLKGFKSGNKNFLKEILGEETAGKLDDLSAGMQRARISEVGIDDAWNPSGTAQELKKSNWFQWVTSSAFVGQITDKPYVAGIGAGVFVGKTYAADLASRVMTRGGVRARDMILASGAGAGVGAATGAALAPEGERGKGALIGGAAGLGLGTLGTSRGVRKMLGNERGQISVYHGTPHKFDKFGKLDDVVGTGEGAQAYGHGLYFTNEKDIARHYAKATSATKTKYTYKGLDVNTFPGDEGRIAAHIVMDGGTESEFGFNKVKNRLSEYLKSKGNTERIDKLNDVQFKDFGKQTPKGNTYSVTLHKGKTPDQYDYLKWDESPTAAQIKKVQSQLKKDKQDGFSYLGSEKITNEDLYQDLSGVFDSDKAASDFLLKAGIDGIDYPAGSISGSAKSGARNYVVFDPNAATIEAVESGNASIGALEATAGASLLGAGAAGVINVKRNKKK